MIRLLWLTVMLLAGSLAGEEMRLSAGTPFFDKPSAEAVLLGVLPEERSVAVSGKPVRVWFRQHPLARYADFYAVNVPGQGTCYVSPALHANPEDRSFRIAGEIPPAGKLLLPAALGILFFLCYRLYRFPKERSNIWIYTGIVIAVRVALLSYVLSMAGAVVCNPADEPGYFAVGYDLLQGKCKGPWSYPVGYGVLGMIPWILLTGAKTYFDIAIAISWVGGFVLGPAALLLAIRVLAVLKIKVTAAFAAVLAWAVLPFFCHHIPDWSTLTFENFWAMPSVGANFAFYMELIGSGFNGMSDMLSTVLVFGILLFALRMPVKSCFLILAAFMFGAACLVRLNNIFFAPVLGYILVERFLPRLRDWRYILWVVLAGSIAYLLTVGLQLGVNFYQFGDIWTFPYSLHALDRAAGDRPADGFTFATLMKGSNLRYLLESNLYVISGGIAGLIWIRDRRLRAVLGLWAIPVILFFCGYSHTFCDAVRFILSAYIPMLGAAAAVLVRPWRENWRPVAGFWIVFLVLMVLGNGYVLFGMLVLVLCRSILDAVLSLIILKKPSAVELKEDGLL